MQNIYWASLRNKDFKVRRLLKKTLKEMSAFQPAGGKLPVTCLLNMERHQDAQNARTGYRARDRTTITQSSAVRD